MRFLIDTNIASAYLKGDRRVFSRFMQHSGGLAISAVCVGELYSWAFRGKNQSRREPLESMLSDFHVLAIDLAVARNFGELRAQLLDGGRPTPEIDLLIASTAFVHDLTLVTNNRRDFEHLKALRLEDWLDDAS